MVALVYWEGRWITEEMRTLACAHPWWSIRRDLRGLWVLVR